MSQLPAAFRKLLNPEKRTEDKSLLSTSDVVRREPPVVKPVDEIERSVKPEIEFDPYIDSYKTEVANRLPEPERPLGELLQTESRSPSLSDPTQYTANPTSVTKVPQKYMRNDQLVNPTNLTNPDEQLDPRSLAIKRVGEQQKRGLGQILKDAALGFAGTGSLFGAGLGALKGGDFAYENRLEQEAKNIEGQREWNRQLQVDKRQAEVEAFNQKYREAQMKNMEVDNELNRERFLESKRAKRQQEAAKRAQLSKNTNQALSDEDAEALMLPKGTILRSEKNPNGRFEVKVLPVSGDIVVTDHQSGEFKVIKATESGITPSYTLRNPTKAAVDAQAAAYAYSNTAQDATAPGGYAWSVEAENEAARRGIDLSDTKAQQEFTSSYQRRYRRSPFVEISKTPEFQKNLASARVGGYSAPTSNTTVKAERPENQLKEVVSRYGNDPEKLEKIKQAFLMENPGFDRKVLDQILRRQTPETKPPVVAAHSSRRVVSKPWLSPPPQEQKATKETKREVKVDKNKQNTKENPSVSQSREGETPSTPKKNSLLEVRPEQLAEEGKKQREQAIEKERERVSKERQSLQTGYKPTRSPYEKDDNPLVNWLTREAAAAVAKNEEMAEMAKSYRLKQQKEKR